MLFSCILLNLWLFWQEHQTIYYSTACLQSFGNLHTKNLLAIKTIAIQIHWMISEILNKNYKQWLANAKQWMLSQFEWPDYALISVTHGKLNAVWLRSLHVCCKPLTRNVYANRLKKKFIFMQQTKKKTLQIFHTQ